MLASNNQCVEGGSRWSSVNVLQTVRKLTGFSPASLDEQVQNSEQRHQTLGLVSGITSEQLPMIGQRTLNKPYHVTDGQGLIL